MSRQPTTWAHASGYRFLLRRIERALLTGDTSVAGSPLGARTVPLAIGCLVAVIMVAGAAVLAVLRPQARLDHAVMVMGQETGALYARVGDTWHPVLNLASARLIAATDSNPQPVRESEMSHTKRGPLLGIPGAPQLLGPPLSSAEAAWAICDTADGTATTVVVGPIEGSSVRRLAGDHALLLTSVSGPPAYLLYSGQRAVVDLADTAVMRALRLEGRAPRVVSQSLLNAVPEVPPITAPRIRGAGGKAAGLPGLRVGSVVRITRVEGDEYYAVLDTGVQRIGPVAADLLRFSDSRAAADIIAVSPDAIRGAQIVNTLPVGTFPERAPGSVEGGLGGADTTVCVSSAATPPGAGFFSGTGLPLPVGRVPVALSQADGRGPALDGVYLPPGRSAYVRARGTAGLRYLVTDTGVRFAVHDDDAAHDLGLQGDAVPVPWPMLAVLPCGPELSRGNASVAHDVVAGPS